MDLRGDPARLRALTGWEPAIPLRQTMADTIEWWERQQARDGGLTAARAARLSRLHESRAGARLPDFATVAPA